MHGKITPGELVSIEEAAKRLGGMHVLTIRRWVAERRIASVKLGSRVFVPESEIERLIKEATRPAVAGSVSA
jgi:excisionase family DNA binding protein